MEKEAFLQLLLRNFRVGRPLDLDDLGHLAVFHDHNGPESPRRVRIEDDPRLPLLPEEDVGPHAAGDLVHDLLILDLVLGVGQVEHLYGRLGHEGDDLPVLLPLHIPLGVSWILVLEVESGHLALLPGQSLELLRDQGSHRPGESLGSIGDGGGWLLHGILGD